MNMEKSLKEKIINHNFITEKELNLFLNYVIHKSKVIASHMTDKKSYTRINLCNEILWSYNIDSNIYKENDRYYCIFYINLKEYLLDIDFNNDDIDFLKKHKYIELNNNILDKYLNRKEEDK